MSGHSKWSTIKHKKALTDARRGQVFTKLAKAITIAAREGGGDDSFNFSLRLAIEKAKQLNMPKSNIDRAIERGVGKEAGAGLEEAIYEGYGPGKISVMIKVVTDNKNRTAAELRKVFETSGGVMGQKGTVSFGFNQKGRLWLALAQDVDAQILQLIDVGVEEVESSQEGVEVLVKPTELRQTQEKLTKLGFVVKQAELEYVPKNKLELNDQTKKKALGFLEQLEQMDDVQNIYTNIL